MRKLQPGAKKVRVEVQADEPLTLVQNWTGLLKQ
jgi:hypothetical protein